MALVFRAGDLDDIVSGVEIFPAVNFKAHAVLALRVDRIDSMGIFGMGSPGRETRQPAHLQGLP
jgi:hypothetical protein